MKEIRLAGRQNVQLRIDMLNALNNLVFTPVSGVGNTTLSSYQITSTALSGRVVQLVARFNW